ncbi:MAG: hypothetical protein ACE3JP_00870 [Ectobacillus sp.]
MYSYRISKYKPNLRDNNDNYTDLEEWTCFSEVGEKLSMDEYLDAEQRYIDAIMIFMDEMNIDGLFIDRLELYSEEIAVQNAKEFISKLWVGKKVNKLEIQGIARLTLRNAVWCKLRLRNQFFVHFGYDYYMFIGASDSCTQALEKIKSMGLYVEAYDSSYL